MGQTCGYVELGTAYSVHSTWYATSETPHRSSVPISIVAADPFSDPWPLTPDPYFPVPFSWRFPMKPIVLSFVVLIVGWIASAASACPVVTNVAVVQAIVPTVAVPVAVQSACAVQQQAAHPQAAAAQAVAPAVEAVPGVTTYAMPAVSFVATPVVVEQIVKVKHHRKFRTPVRSFLFR